MLLGDHITNLAVLRRPVVIGILRIAFARSTTHVPKISNDNWTTQWPNVAKLPRLNSCRKEVFVCCHMCVEDRGVAASGRHCCDCRGKQIHEDLATLINSTHLQQSSWWPTLITRRHGRRAFLLRARRAPISYPTRRSIGIYGPCQHIVCSQQTKLSKLISLTSSIQSLSIMSSFFCWRNLSELGSVHWQTSFSASFPD